MAISYRLKDYQEKCPLATEARRYLIFWSIKIDCLNIMDVPFRNGSTELRVWCKIVYVTGNIPIFSYKTKTLQLIDQFYLLLDKLYS